MLVGKIHHWSLKNWGGFYFICLFHCLRSIWHSRNLNNNSHRRKKNRLKIFSRKIYYFLLTLVANHWLLNWGVGSKENLQRSYVVYCPHLRMRTGDFNCLAIFTKLTEPAETFVTSLVLYDFFKSKDVSNLIFLSKSDHISDAR